ncbi:MAG: co-chaperone GroES [Planctomycetes bacterium]|jgi:chaperonin GroES|nr:co-chaperone GroES [Planctomycetota bacterium]HNZ67609.1 co-chaperone GroES [Planctomycetota bacterium]HPY75823.1 co-chaperone GroES [Planctomycetota bacterium]HQB01399.1 co-chaperone GroES [Planctomycetota bacterium]HRU52417.1 co-chaperone GroES [Planctomycetota bacterium]
MTLQPLDDRLIVEIEAAEAKTAGGIVLPETAKEKPQRGTILAVGPGKLLENGERVAMILKEKDKIIFGKYAGTEVKIDGKEYKILRESEVLAKFEN